eukprot:s2335_g1.t1
MKLRKRILATAATGANKPIEALLTADFRHLEGSSKKRGQMSAEAATIRDAKDRRIRAGKRGQMSAEAATIRDAKDRRIRAGKLNFSSVAQRFDQDQQFRTRMMQEGRNIEDKQKFDYLSYAVLPDPGRSEEQRHLRAGSHYMSEYGRGATAAPAKLVFYAHCEVEPLRALRLIDDVPLDAGALLPSFPASVAPLKLSSLHLNFELGSQDLAHAFPFRFAKDTPRTALRARHTRLGVLVSSRRSRSERVWLVVTRNPELV